MKKLLLGSALLFMFGCEDLTGTLTAFESFKVNAKGGVQTVVAGAHKTSLNFKKNKVVANIETGGSTIKMNLTIPENSVIPANGNFDLLAKDSGQPFDVHGTVDTVVTQSQRQSGYETCSYQDTDVSCGPQGCQQIPVTRWGQQYVEYFVRTTQKDMSFDLVSANGTVAHFDGSEKTSEKIITAQGRCH